MGCGSSKRKVYSNIIVPCKQEKSQIKLNLIPEATNNKKNKQNWNLAKADTIAEINEAEMKKEIAKINEKRKLILRR